MHYHPIPCVNSYMTNSITPVKKQKISRLEIFFIYCYTNFSLIA